MSNKKVIVLAAVVMSLTTLSSVFANTLTINSAIVDVNKPSFPSGDG